MTANSNLFGVVQHCLVVLWGKEEITALHFCNPEFYSFNGVRRGTELALMRSKKGSPEGAGVFEGMAPSLA